MSRQQTSADDVTAALATLGINITKAGRQRARRTLADADRAHTTEKREAARQRYARYTHPA